VGTDARYASEAEHGPPAGRHIAHAEILALRHLSTDRRYPDHVLYTSLEPCLMCAGAASMSLVGDVRYAAADPYGGAVASIRSGNAHLRRTPTRFAGRAAAQLAAASGVRHGRRV
jgi:tRNA(Arg) A34 adenosine deaminase TadA